MDTCTKQHSAHWQSTHRLQFRGFYLNNLKSGIPGPSMTNSTLSFLPTPDIDDSLYYCQVTKLVKLQLKSVQYF